VCLDTGYFCTKSMTKIQQLLQGLRTASGRPVADGKCVCETEHSLSMSTRGFFTSLQILLAADLNDDAFRLYSVKVND